MEKNNTLLPDIAKWGNILHRFNKFVLSNKEINPKETILIVGTPRSGTTWFEEMMINVLDYTFLHEPLHPNWFPESVKTGFKARSSYLSPEAECKEGEQYLKKTFQGKVYSLLPAYSLDSRMMMNYLLGDKLIVKSVRMNRILPWVANKFQLKHIYLVIRHPCAVIASQLKSGFIGYHSTSPPYDPVFPTVENILDEASEIKGLDFEIVERLKKIETKEEILAAAWCLDTFVPLNSKKPYPWTTIFYEKYLKKREQIINSIFDEIGIEKTSSSAAKFVNKPSMSVRKEETKTVTTPDKQLSKWKKALSEKQISRILKVVSDFDLDFYNENIEPDYDRISV